MFILYISCFNLASELNEMHPQEKKKKRYKICHWREDTLLYLIYP